MTVAAYRPWTFLPIRISSSASIPNPSRHGREWPSPLPLSHAVGEGNTIKAIGISNSLDPAMYPRSNLPLQEHAFGLCDRRLADACFRVHLPMSAIGYSGRNT